MRVPAVAGVLLLACAAGLVAVPLLDAAGASAGAVGARGSVESHRIAALGDAGPGSSDAGWDPSAPPAPPLAGYGEGIGVLFIPALGADYRRVVAEGVGLDVLDRPEIGHFPGSAGPGQVGNFALAGHRSTALLRLADVAPGDRVYLQTAEGWYTYEVREEHSVVDPTAVEVVAPVPGFPGQEATERLLTLITCYPEWGDAERLVLHAVFLEWRPLRAGSPDGIPAT
jgi:sortase A